MNKESFHSSKHPFFQFLFLLFPIGSIIVILAMAIITFTNFSTLGTFLITLVAFPLATLILWLMLHAYRNTSYTIQEDTLCYQMGILKGSIPISKIWLIKASTYPTSGNRPALDWNGLKIVYGADHVLFVSPKSQDDFITLLKQKNNAIEVML